MYPFTLKRTLTFPYFGTITFVIVLQTEGTVGDVLIFVFETAIGNQIS